MQLSDSERASGRLAPSTVHAAVEHVRNNGFVLFERVLPRDLVADMQSSFARLIDTHSSSTEANRGANRFQMHLPFEPPFNDERLIASTFVLPIVDALIGADCICHYLASDTPLPGSDYQEVHPDIFPLFPEWPAAMPPYSIVLNTPLIDVTPDNGPLEIYDVLVNRVFHKRGVVMYAVDQLLPELEIEASKNLSELTDSRFGRIRLETYERLSERGRRLFRHEAIGVAADGLHDLSPAQFYALPS